MDGTNKYAVVRFAVEITFALNYATVFTHRFIELNTDPFASLEAC